MLIAQGPLRISLVGGGSDLPSFLERNDGAVLSFAINRRVFIIGHPFTHRPGILLKYSQTEDVSAPSEIRHPIAREVLSRYHINDIDLAVMADVPAGTGLGSSSSFTVALLAFVRHLVGEASTPVDLATEACEIEIGVLGEPIGYQDQWASALGGVNVIRFSHTDVKAESVGLTAESVRALEKNLHLIPIGKPRSAGSLLANQTQALSGSGEADDITRALAGLVDQGKRILQSSLDDLGPLLDEAWSLKRRVNSGISNDAVDVLYTQGRAAGATGGKLLGAGGSGYFAFYVPSSAHEEFAEVFPSRLFFEVSNQGAGVIHES